jgi:hypothetical protein
LLGSCPDVTPPSSITLVPVQTPSGEDLAEIGAFGSRRQLLVDGVYAAAAFVTWMCPGFSSRYPPKITISLPVHTALASAVAGSGDGGSNRQR